jgi:hypothetical protein
MGAGRIARAGAVAAVGAGVAGVIADRALAATGRSPIRPIDISVEIAAPLDEVWAVASDIPRQPEWMREMKSVRIVTPGPVREGTEAEATVRIFGIAVVDPVVVSEWAPPHRFGIRHVGLFTGGGRLTLREGIAAAPGIPPTTQIRWREVLVPPLLPHVGAIVQWPILRWIFQDDLYRLRDLIEEGSAEAARDDDGGGGG